MPTGNSQKMELLRNKTDVVNLAVDETFDYDSPVIHRCEQLILKNISQNTGLSSSYIFMIKYTSMYIHLFSFPMFTSMFIQHDLVCKYMLDLGSASAFSHHLLKYLFNKRDLGWKPGRV